MSGHDTIGHWLGLPKYRGEEPARVQSSLHRRARWPLSSFGGGARAEMPARGLCARPLGYVTHVVTELTRALHAERRPPPSPPSRWWTLAWAIIARATGVRASSPRGSFHSRAPHALLPSTSVAPPVPPIRRSPGTARPKSHAATNRRRSRRRELISAALSNAGGARRHRAGSRQSRIKKSAHAITDVNGDQVRSSPAGSRPAPRVPGRSPHRHCSAPPSYAFVGRVTALRHLRALHTFLSPRSAIPCNFAPQSLSEKETRTHAPPRAPGHRLVECSSPQGATRGRRPRPHRAAPPPRRRSRRRAPPGSPTRRASSHEAIDPTRSRAAATRRHAPSPSAAPFRALAISRPVLRAPPEPAHLPGRLLDRDCYMLPCSGLLRVLLSRFVGRTTSAGRGRAFPAAAPAPRDARGTDHPLRPLAQRAAFIRAEWCVGLTTSSFARRWLHGRAVRAKAVSSRLRRARDYIPSQVGGGGAALGHFRFKRSAK
jgi:hypothetical protein